MKKHKPYDTRHTGISMMADASVNSTIQKKIAGHSGAMSRPSACTHIWISRPSSTASTRFASHKVFPFCK